MVVAHIGANGLSLETDTWGRARGESRGFRQQPRGTRPLSCVSLGACDITWPPSFLSVGGTRRCTLLGKKRRTNGSNMGEPIRTREGLLAGRVEHDARLGRVVQVKKRGGGNPLIFSRALLHNLQPTSDGRLIFASCLAT